MATTKIRNGQINVTTDFDINSQKLTNVATPVSSTDAANKAYVDGVAQGLDVKDSVRAASTADLTLSGAQTIDGVSVIAGDRVLVKDQTTAADNGIYVAAAGAWARSSDADTSAEVTAGMFAFVEEGTANGDTGWVLTTDNPITLGTTALAFTQFTGAGTITAGAGLTKTGSTLDVVSGNGGIVANANDITLTLNGSSLNVGASGLKIADGTPGQVMLGTTTTGEALFTTLSGDVSSISGAGAVTLAATVLKQASIVTNETPSGLVNGANTSYSLANTPVSGTERVYLNGIRLEPGAGNDYTISTATITMLTAPATGDKLRVDYFK
jgi:phage-related tail fiber protein